MVKSWKLGRAEQKRGFAWGVGEREKRESELGVESDKDRTLGLRDGRKRDEADAADMAGVAPSSLVLKR